MNRLALGIVTLASIAAVACAAPPAEEPIGEDQSNLSIGKPPPGEKCGDAFCAAGTVCCNSSCGICTPPGWACTQQVCETSPPPRVPVEEAGEKCGDNVCPSGTTCCNPSCGICLPPGRVCTQQICEPKPPPPVPAAGEPAPGEKCGDNTCASGEVCCNASCGICTPPGWSCTQQYCPPVR